MSGFAGPVYSIGECLIDLIAAPDTDLSNAGALTIREGGAPMNVAVGLARLGVPSAMCSVVGRDPFGDRLIALLQHEGVDVRHLRQTEEAETSIAYAWRDSRGDGQFRLLRLADRLLEAADIDRIDFAPASASASALVFGSVALAAQPSRSAVEHAVAVAREKGIPLVFDVNVRPTLWPDLAILRDACEPLLRHVTVLKFSLDDAEAMWSTRDLNHLQTLLDDLAAPFIIVTDGAREVWARRGAERMWSRHPVFPVDAVEPTGAGDAFTAALLARLLACHWEGLGDADLRFAMASGAIATTKPGAIAALPGVSDIERFLAAHVVR